MKLTMLLLALVFAGCASKTASTTCQGVTDTLASPCLAAANVCQALIKLPCFAMPNPTPEATVVP